MNRIGSPSTQYQQRSLWERYRREKLEKLDKETPLDRCLWLMSGQFQILLYLLNHPEEKLDLYAPQISGMRGESINGADLKHDNDVLEKCLRASISYKDWAWYILLKEIGDNPMLSLGRDGLESIKKTKLLERIAPSTGPYAAEVAAVARAIVGPLVFLVIAKSVGLAGVLPLLVDALRNHLGLVCAIGALFNQEPIAVLTPLVQAAISFGVFAVKALIFYVCSDKASPAVLSLACAQLCWPLINSMEDFLKRRWEQSPNKWIPFLGFCLSVSKFTLGAAAIKGLTSMVSNGFDSGYQPEPNRNILETPICSQSAELCVRAALEVLNLKELPSSPYQLRQAYKGLSFRNHPDMTDDTDHMVLVNLAYRFLKEFIRNSTS